MTKTRKVKHMQQLAHETSAPKPITFQCPRSDTAKWPDVCVELLIKLWAEGLYASDIKKQVHTVRLELTGLPTTRNGVIAKAHRTLVYKNHEWLPLHEAFPRAMGPRAVSRKDRLATNRRVRRQKQPDQAPKIAKPPRTHLPLRVLPPLEPAPSGVIRVLDLKESMCHWPIGDPMEDGFHFCGRRKTFGVPYCEHHAAIAYNPIARRAA